MSIMVCKLEMGKFVNERKTKKTCVRPNDGKIIKFLNLLVEHRLRCGEKRPDRDRIGFDLLLSAIIAAHTSNHHHHHHHQQVVIINNNKLVRNIESRSLRWMCI